MVKYLVISLVFLIGCHSASDCTIQDSLLETYRIMLKNAQQISEMNCDLGILAILKTLSRDQIKRAGIKKPQLEQAWAECEKLSKEAK